MISLLVLNTVKLIMKPAVHLELFCFFLLLDNLYLSLLDRLLGISTSEQVLCMQFECQNDFLTFNILFRQNKDKRW